MNILTIDIEDWFHCDFISEPSTWNNYETRIFKSTDNILEALDDRKLKATFFKKLINVPVRIMPCFL